MVISVTLVSRVIMLAGDVALSFTDSTSDYAMKNNVYFSNSTLMGDVAFTSTWNANFDPSGHDSNGDGVKDTNAGWVDDSLNVDELNITLNNGSKWVGQATFNAETISPDTMYDVATNSLTLVAQLKLMVGIASSTIKYSRVVYLT